MTSCIHIAGDSTASNYPRDQWPRAGWGMLLEQHLKQGITVRNLAQSGRSTKSFVDQGWWQLLCSEISDGDYVFIQFGHNDEKTEDPERYAEAGGAFSKNLERMVNEAKTAGAQPVLITPVARRNFVDGSLVPTHGAYSTAVCAVAAAMNVPLLDLESLSSRLYENLGEAGSKNLFMHLQPGKYKAWPEGSCDNTHFTVHGACTIAFLVATLMQDVPGLCRLLP